MSPLELLDHVIDVRLGRAAPQNCFAFCSACGRVFYSRGFGDDAVQALRREITLHDPLVHFSEKAERYFKDEQQRKIRAKGLRTRDPYG